MRRPLHWGRLGFVAVSLLVGTPKAHSAGDILSISPRCAPPGATVTIRGRGFGATNVSIVVGGVQAQILQATGYQVVFVIPSQLPPGVVSVVAAVNPGGQTGSIALRIKGSEICGNGIDDDCDGIVDDPDICTPVNHQVARSKGVSLVRRRNGGAIGSPGTLPANLPLILPARKRINRWNETTEAIGTQPVGEKGYSLEAQGGTLKSALL